MSRRRKVAAFVRLPGAVALALVLCVAPAAGNTESVARATAPARGAQSALLNLAGPMSASVPSWMWTALGQPQTISPGADGVLNVLLLASDARSGGVSRTDTVMVVSFKSIGGQMTMRAASIPRDTARIPNPFTASTTDTFSGRINGIVRLLKGDGNTTEQALAKFEIVIERLLNITIDYHALITFKGFHAMVGVVDPVAVNIAGEIKDPKYWDDPDKPQGVYFPQRDNYNLWASQPGEESGLCNGGWKTLPIVESDWCRRAMPYVRSRKGAGNSDFKRAARQQTFIHATIRDVTTGVPGGHFTLADLLSAAQGQDSANQLYTSFDLTIGNVSDIYNRIRGSALGNRVVFSPTTYATRITGTTAYRLKLDVVRAWANTNLK